jgi:small conductance mechanosensitive channel
MTDWLDQLQASVWYHWLPLAVTLFVILVIHVGLRRWFVHEHQTGHFSRYREQFLNLLLAVASLLAIIIASPINNELRGQLLSLFGIVVSATIALSSTTLMGNLLGGVMLRSVSSLKAGDFIRINGEFGRISQRGLLHIEIQTEDSDLTTLPNLYLVQNPFTVIRSEGTFISAEVSLGYELNQHQVEKALLAAIKKAGLEDGFVQVRELGDYSVIYRASGKLNEVKQIVTARSKLRSAMLDVLHGAGVEIVSPTFMNQRQLDPSSKIIPKHSKPVDEKKEGEIEQAVFEKAEKAENAEQLESKLRKVAEAMGECREEAKAASGDEAEKFKQKEKALKRQEERLTELLEQAREAAKSHKKG